MGTSQRAPALISIQILRAVACLMVLLHHARNPKDWMFSPLARWDFTSGVEIFFVISGFIMYTAARDEAPREFLRRRVIRIWPLYAIATLTWAAWMAMHGMPQNDLGHFVLSLFLVPHANPIHPLIIWPVLSPGWTLCYEMFFYLLFAAGLAMRRVGALCVGVIAVLAALGVVFHPVEAVLHAATAPILLAFVAGIAIAWGRDKTWFAKGWPLAVVGAGALALQASPLVQWSEFWVVLASAALVAGFVALEPLVRTRRLRTLRALGDASYSIYLFHTLVLAQVLWSGYSLPLKGWPQFLLLVGSAIVLSIAVGLAVHQWVEKPMLAALLKLGRAPRPPQPVCSVAGEERQDAANDQVTLEAA